MSGPRSVIVADDATVVTVQAAGSLVRMVVDDEAVVLSPDLALKVAAALVLRAAEAERLVDP